jgi:hypothetical protein
MEDTPIRTGEEDEECVFRESAQLFEFEEGGWKGLGRGVLRINRNKENHQARLLMKGHSGLHLLLNANLWSGMVRVRHLQSLTADVGPRLSLQLCLER